MFDLLFSLLEGQLPGLLVLVLLGVAVFVERMTEFLHNAGFLGDTPASTINKVISFILPLLFSIATVLGLDGDALTSAQNIALEIVAILVAFASSTAGAWLIHQVMKIVSGDVVFGFLRSVGPRG